VTGERQLRGRREDPHEDVPVVLRRIDERRLGDVQLLREALELMLGNPPRVGEDGELVARESLVREDVADDVAVAIGHFKRL
jgi:hypothetical protein